MKHVAANEANIARFGRSADASAMTEYHNLKHRMKYKIVKIIDDFYIVVEGFENAAGGGLYWTEFSAT
jgi:hypothetical protein